MTTMMSSDITLEFNEGTQILKADLKDKFAALEYMNIYTTVYELCTQMPLHRLYGKYRDSFDEYIALSVLPALENVRDEFMSRELVKCWGNHKVMVRLMSNMFSCLEHCYVEKGSVQSLMKVGIMCFRDMVYNSIKTKVKNVLIQLINREREGEQIDCALLRSVLNIIVEMGMDHLNFYEEDFEAAMLEETGAYYSKKAALWLFEYSCPDYMLKAEECLRREK